MGIFPRKRTPISNSIENIMVIILNRICSPGVNAWVFIMLQKNKFLSQNGSQSGEVLALSPPDKLSSAEFFVCFHYQSVSVLLKSCWKCCLGVKQLGSWWDAKLLKAVCILHFGRAWQAKGWRIFSEGSVKSIASKEVTVERGFSLEDRQCVE